MMFVLILGLLLGGAVVVLFQQWRSAVLAPASLRRLPRATPRGPAVAKGGGLFFVPASRRRRAA